MADDKDLGFKISDHRKFNPDGTLRERDSQSDTAEFSSEGAIISGASATGQAEGGSGKVLTFPGEPDREKPQAPGAAANPQASRPQQSQHSAGPVVPNPSFDELVNMLTVEAVMHLGLIESPTGEGITVDLEAAHHMIDMLGMLQEKTSGNLTPDESLLIDNVLADLRMQFVAISRAR